jgi:hypothetical protein
VKITAWIDRMVASDEPDRVDVSTGARSSWSLAGKHYTLDSKLMFSMERPDGEFEKLQSDWRKRCELIDAAPESAVDEAIEIRVVITFDSEEVVSVAAMEGGLEALVRDTIGGTKYRDCPPDRCR